MDDFHGIGKKAMPDVGLIMVEAHGYKAGEKAWARDLDGLTFFGKAWEDMTKEIPSPADKRPTGEYTDVEPRDVEFLEDATGFDFTLIGAEQDMAYSCGAACEVDHAGWEDALKGSDDDLLAWATERMAHGFCRFVVKCHYQVDQTGGYLDVEPDYDSYVALDGVVDLGKVRAEEEAAVPAEGLERSAEGSAQAIIRRAGMDCPSVQVKGLRADIEATLKMYWRAGRNIGRHSHIAVGPREGENENVFAPEGGA